MAERVCTDCGQVFEQRSAMGRPRTLCYECKPDKNTPPQVVASIPGEPFTVDHFIAWASYVQLDDGGAWTPDPFFVDFVRDVFSGTKECWLIVPEGSGKTTSLAGLTLYCAEFRDASSIPWAASSRDQAELGYLQAEGMVENTPRLKSQFKCLPGYRRIRHKTNRSRIQVFAADDRTGDGVMPTFAVVDELHRHRNLRLYRTWRGKLNKRDGQICVISTAGEPGSEFEVARERMRQLPNQTRDRCYVRAEGNGAVLHEWAIPEKGDPTDLGLVLAANPSPRVTMETLTEKYNSPTFDLSHWTRLTANLATRDTRSAITEQEWLSAMTKDAIPAGSDVWLGMDVAWKWDTTAIVTAWESGDRVVLGPAVILTPPRDGSSLDPALIEDALVQLCDTYRVHTIVMDTSRAEQLSVWIRDVLGCDVVDRQQTNPLACMDYERFMSGLRTGQLFHSGDAGLTQHVMNAIARQLPEGKVRFDRPVQNRTGNTVQDLRVIDALTAAAMVNSQLMAGRDIIDKEPPRAIDLNDIPDEDEDDDTTPEPV